MQIVFSHPRCQQFKDFRKRILVATNLFRRGMDIEQEGYLHNMKIIRAGSGKLHVTRCPENPDEADYRHYFLLCNSCSVPAALYLPCPCCPVNAVLSLLSCPCCPVIAFLSLLSYPCWICPCCPVLAVLFLLNLSLLSCRCCPILAEPVLVCLSLLPFPWYLISAIMLYPYWPVIYGTVQSASQKFCPVLYLLTLHPP